MARKIGFSPRYSPLATRYPCAVIRLADTVCAWGRPDFEQVFKHELSAQAEALPLQSGLRHSDRALTDDI